MPLIALPTQKYKFGRAAPVALKSIESEKISPKKGDQIQSNRSELSGQWKIQRDAHQKKQPKRNTKTNETNSHENGYPKTESTENKASITKGKTVDAVSKQNDSLQKTEMIEAKPETKHLNPEVILISPSSTHEINNTGNNFDSLPYVTINSVSSAGSSEIDSATCDTAVSMATTTTTTNSAFPTIHPSNLLADDLIHNSGAGAASSQISLSSQASSASSIPSSPKSGRYGSRLGIHAGGSGDGSVIDFTAMPERWSSSMGTIRGAESRCDALTPISGGDVTGKVTTGRGQNRGGHQGHIKVSTIQDGRLPGPMPPSSPAQLMKKQNGATGNDSNAHANRFRCFTMSFQNRLECVTFYTAILQIIFGVIMVSMQISTYYTVVQVVFILVITTGALSVLSGITTLALDSNKFNFTMSVILITVCSAAGYCICVMIVAYWEEGATQDLCRGESSGYDHKNKDDNEGCLIKNRVFAITFLITVMICCAFAFMSAILILCKLCPNKRRVSVV